MGIPGRLLCLKEAYHLVDGAPHAHSLRLCPLCCLVLHLHFVLAYVGDVETMVVA